MFSALTSTVGWAKPSRLGCCVGESSACFQCPLPGESERVRWIPSKRDVTTCVEWDVIYEGGSLGLVTWAPSAWHVPTFQTHRRKSGVQWNPHMHFGYSSHSSQVGWRVLPKPKFRDQWRVNQVSWPFYGWQLLGRAHYSSFLHTAVTAFVTSSWVGVDTRQRQTLEWEAMGLMLKRHGQPPMVSWKYLTVRNTAIASPLVPSPAFHRLPRTVFSLKFISREISSSSSLILFREIWGRGVGRFKGCGA